MLRLTSMGVLLLVGLAGCSFNFSSSSSASRRPAGTGKPAQASTRQAGKPARPASAPASKPARPASSAPEAGKPTSAARKPTPEPSNEPATRKTAAKRVPPVQPDPPTRKSVTTPPSRNRPSAPPPRRTRPGVKETGVTVACSFSQGWVAVLPADLYDPGEEFLMQALIGLSEEPSFWSESYAKLEPYKARPCTANGQRFDLPAGDYMIAVGQAGQFATKGEYRNNGFLAPADVSDGSMQVISLSEADLAHTWLCISCPYLVIFRDGAAVEAGQVLVDRYRRERRGTDVVRERVDVRDGRVTLRIEEREPERTFLDAVQVRVAGVELRPVATVPAAVRAIDLDVHPLDRGDETTLVFEAPHLPDGVVEAEIAVSGYYEPFDLLR